MAGSTTGSQIAAGGAGADPRALEDRAPNLARLIWDRVRESPTAEAYRYPVDHGETTLWHAVNWQQTGDRVAKLAGALLALGLGWEDRVGIVSGTRFEWILADLAVMAAGGATTTVYPSSKAADVAYILADSGSRVVFAEDAGQVAKLREHRGELPQLERVVCFEDGAEQADEDDWVVGLEEFGATGAAHLAAHPGALDRIAAEVPPTALATLIYTSGTTGRPKGVRLTHDAWSYEGAAIKAQGTLGADDLQFLWLPLAHAFGKVLLSTQLAIGFPTAVDGRVDRIVDNLGVVRPTFMGAAPRIFEKAYARIVTMQQTEGGVKEKVFNRAFAVGVEVDRLRAEGRRVPTALRLQRALFDRLVFSKVRERFGGRVRFFISGSAALNRDIAAWFDAAGVTILEGYGLTETAAGATVNLPDANRLGTVGPPLPGAQTRISDEGEVLIRGPHVMAGYHNLPEETAAAFAEDGWLRTGDKGSLDADGYLQITGRIKELFKTSGGKYVAPPMIEGRFKAICPYASQFLVFGEERNYCVALITLDEEALADWARQRGLPGDYAALVATPEVRELVGGYVEELNAGLNRWETIKKWRLLDHDLSVDSGELTPSLKVKRGLVEETYRGEIDALYSS